MTKNQRCRGVGSGDAGGRGHQQIIGQRTTAREIIAVQVSTHNTEVGWMNGEKIEGLTLVLGEPFHGRCVAPIRPLGRGVHIVVEAELFGARTLNVGVNTNLVAPLEGVVGHTGHAVYRGRDLDALTCLWFGATA